MFLVLVGLLIWSVVEFFTNFASHATVSEVFLLIAWALVAVGCIIELLPAAGTNYATKWRNRG